MGFFSDLWNSVCEVASNVWEGVKEVAGNVLGWVADKAERFIGFVGKVWHTVKVFIKPILKIIQLIPWPPLQAAAAALERAINYLERIEKSALATELGQAVNWSIKAARSIREYILDERERRKAIKRKEVFSESQQYLSGEESQAIQLAEIINEFILVQTEIDDVFQRNSVDDFEHYLRLRATQKLLRLTEISLEKGKDLNSISRDELFLLEIGRELLKKNPVINEKNIQKLNDLVHKRYGKNLIPFVFEEMIVAWSKTLTEEETEWEIKNRRLAEDIIRLRNLENNEKFEVELTEAELNEMKILRMLTINSKESQSVLLKSISEKKNYLYAAEGFLQILEENEGLAEKEYLIQEGGRVGKIIIDCAEYGKKWDELTLDEQDLITDFANIFRNASLEREKLLQVEVA